MTALSAWGYWFLAAAVLYPYLIYPAVLWILIKVRGAYQPRTRDPAEWPTVSLIISAFNEAAVLDAKLRNARALDYPPDLLQILVISDASDDGTDDIVRQHARDDLRIVLHRQLERRGKTAGLNRGIELTSGAVVVFSDANAMYDAGAWPEGDADREVRVQRGEHLARAAGVVTRLRVRGGERARERVAREHGEARLLEVALNAGEHFVAVRGRERGVAADREHHGRLRRCA